MPVSRGNCLRRSKTMSYIEEEQALKTFWKSLVVIAMALSLMGGVVFASEQLTLQGSTTVLPVAQAAAEQFMSENPDVNISVRGGGSGNGIAALIDGAVDIANASRFIKDKEAKAAFENGIYAVPHRVAMDGLAVVVHPNNPVKELTIEQLNKIYKGEIRNWKELGGPNKRIVVISRDTSSGTYEVWEEKVMHGERVTPEALLQASNGAVASIVAQTQGAIGYVGLGYVNETLKVVNVSVDGKKFVEPTLTTVANGSYPIARALFMFTNGWPKGTAAQFINFVLSPAGQKIVKEVGFVPLYPVD